jgi:alcohol dehydrogenase
MKMKTTMKAAWIEEPWNIYVKDVPVPTIIEPTDVIAKLTLGTICTSDIHALSGEAAILPLIIGHEYCAEVLEVGPEVKKFKPGDRCLCLPAVYDGTCDTCKQGQICFCENYGTIGNGSSSLNGVFSEYVRVPLADRSMFLIPEGLTEEDVIFATDVLPTAYFALKNGGVSEGKSVAIYGAGPIGLAAGLLAKKMFKAKTVIAVDKLQYRLDLALEKGCADYVINANDEDPSVKIFEITGNGANVVIDTAGNQEVLTNGLSSLAYFGVFSSIAVLLEPMEVNWASMITRNLTLKSGLQALEGIEEFMYMIKRGELDVKWMATHKAPLNDIAKGFEVFGQHQDNCIKWLVTPYEE